MVPSAGLTGKTIDELAVGDAVEVTRTVTAETIREFVGASGDANPIHSDEVFAAATRFGRVIAPGLLTGSFVSGVIGTRLPGPGAIYLSQSLRFLKPVHVGDRVTTRVEVTERVVEKNRLRLATTCRGQDGELVLDGEAWVLPPRVRVVYEGPSARAVVWEPIAWAWSPSTLTAQVLALWMQGGLALASQLAALYRQPGAGRSTEADPVRP